ncbi:MAG: carbamoyl-phosphate synthase large subunit [Chloroflexota bacterium]|nr:carbamoyl-phosphate synthase large subunit [Chloroflexota bacterium]MDE3194393.1 carbamoyl-phosphate synthase large subunit [Chloroflexota bacterium]
MKVLLIGSGPILIGQAAEFDYAGTQACRALREEGVETVLVNSNPATIMTDPGVADITYLEPLTPEVLERVIAKEKPDALLPTLGGQTGLNLAVALYDTGILDRHGVRLLGTPITSIKQAEDREAFKQLLISIGEPVPESVTAQNVEDALVFAERIGYPLVIRPAYTLGGTGGGFAHDRDELVARVRYGIGASPIGQVLVERSLVGWKEIEYEVMRDGADACITVCNMENIDPMGVHTGDSIVVAPSQTLSDKEYQQLRSASLRIIRALGIEGGCNIQFGLHPDRTPADHADGRVPYYVIEVNPRVSRSSALASKATGYPIARVAAKIAIGKRLHEIPNAVTKRTTAAFEPTLDYVVVKIPRWPFDKFPNADRRVGTQMKATGEVMAIDRTFEAALLKALRSLEVKGQGLLWESKDWAGIRDPGELVDKTLQSPPTDERLWRVLAALRRGADVERIHRATHIDLWFLERFKNIVRSAEAMQGATPTPATLRRAKRMGFSDADIGTLTGILSADVRRLREQWGILPVYKMVDTCAAEFEAVTPYFYSTYEQENEAECLPGPKAIVLGSGPIRIGQGIEFDCCCVQAAGSLATREIRSIMVNSNPETVSTDFDASARLYFEPLDEESIAEVIRNEGGEAKVFTQFGGQTALNLAERIEAVGGRIAGTSADSIGLAEDRRRFHEFADALGIPQPPGGTADSLAEAVEIATRVGHPVLVRPSFVLGGRGMEIAYSADDLERYFASALEAGTGRVLVDKYVRGREVEVDAVSDGTDTLVAGIMEHIERAGVHSGDSFATYPAQNLSAAERAEIVSLTRRIASSLPVKGLLNIQFIVEEPMRGAAPPSDPPAIFVIEVNPRASRTVPFLTKVTGVPLVRLAVAIGMGSTLRAEGYARDDGIWPEDSLVAVKAPVFSMAKLLEVDTYLGPEMKSTGEVMGIDRSFAPALWKSLVASGMAPAPSGKVLVTVADKDKAEAAVIIEGLHWLGYEIVATSGTAALARSLGVGVTEVPKLADGDRTILDLIRSGTCAAVINTPTMGKTVDRDGFLIRRAAVEARVPCLTSLDTALAVVTALRASSLAYEVAPLSVYRAGAATGTAQPVASAD